MQNHPFIKKHEWISVCPCHVHAPWISIKMNGFFGMDVTMDFAWKVQLGLPPNLPHIPF